MAFFPNIFNKCHVLPWILVGARLHCLGGLCFCLFVCCCFSQVRGNLFLFESGCVRSLTLKDEVVGAGERSRAGNPHERCKSNTSTNYWMTAVIQTAGRHGPGSEPQRSGLNLKNEGQAH